MFNDFVEAFVDDTTKNDKILKDFFATSATANRPAVLVRFLR